MNPTAWGKGPLTFATVEFTEPSAPQTASLVCVAGLDYLTVKD